LNAIEALSAVGGNQSRYLFDFSPASVILRLTDDPAPRTMFAFESNGGTDEVKLDQLLLSIKSGDIHGSEVIVGGKAARIDQADSLRECGVTVCEGVKQAFQQARERLLS